MFVVVIDMKQRNNAEKKKRCASAMYGKLSTMPRNKKSIEG